MPSPFLLSFPISHPPSCSDPHSSSHECLVRLDSLPLSPAMQTLFQANSVQAQAVWYGNMLLCQKKHQCSNIFFERTPIYTPSGSSVSRPLTFQTRSTPSALYAFAAVRRSRDSITAFWLIIVGKHSSTSLENMMYTHIFYNVVRHCWEPVHPVGFLPSGITRRNLGHGGQQSLHRIEKFGRVTSPR